MRAVFPVFGEADSWFQWCNLSMEVSSPCLQAVKHPYDYSELAKRVAQRPHSGISALSKAMLYGLYSVPDKPILICDVDMLFLDKFDWAPEREETVIAMAPGGDPKYIHWLNEAGIIQIPEHLNNVYNCGVIWLKTDVFDLWNNYYKTLDRVVRNPFTHMGEVLWNAIWYHFYREGKAEMMPQRYNQLYVQHGPGGAAILHFAGSPSVYRDVLMKNCFHFFFEETKQKGIWRRKEFS